MEREVFAIEWKIVLPNHKKAGGLQFIGAPKKACITECRILNDKYKGIVKYKTIKTTRNFSK